MELLIWLVVQVAMFALVWWICMRRREAVEPQIVKHKSTQRQDSRELRDLKEMRARSLNVPLSEKARPTGMEDIIGQEEGVRALRAAICGPNPQHVLIYGPPGIGKTCAARLVLEEAKARVDSPFTENSRFVEMDATCVRFDERAIADPLMGSVHDPIYQGAGALGAQGVPQPKPGAVSRAHCGVLFLDEIGELHPMQMNKLLKVLEDRRVFFDSAYYSRDNKAIPEHIHDIFENGLPADFRLIGATTRSPEELPSALRSRCVEIYFRPLTHGELRYIVEGAAERLGYGIDGETASLAALYCLSGRDAVNMIQLAGGAAYDEGRDYISPNDIEWVAEVCHASRRVTPRMPEEPRPGVCIGLAVMGDGQGMVVEIECSARRTMHGCGTLDMGGVVESEEIELRARRLRRKSTARTSAENVRGAFLKRFALDCDDYDIRYNVPGGMPMDGPSAGIALAVALMSAISGRAPAADLAMTGEITVNGGVRPVGGVREKLAAAIEAGAKTVIVPEANYEESFAKMNARVIPASDISEVMRVAFSIPCEAEEDGVIPIIFSA